MREFIGLCLADVEVGTDLFDREIEITAFGCFHRNIPLSLDCRKNATQVGPAQRLLQAKENIKPQIESLHLAKQTQLRYNILVA